MLDILLKYPEASVLLSLAVIATISVFLLKGNIFFPASIYFIIQTFMLGIAYIKLVPSMTDFKLNTWLVWGGGSVCFIFGCICAFLVWKACNRGQPTPENVPIYNYNWKLHFLLSFSSFAFFMIGVGAVVVTAGNFILFTENPPYWLDGQHSPVLKYSIFFTSSPMVISLFGVAAFKALNPVRWIRVASRIMIFLTIVLGFITFPSRGVNMIGIGALIIGMNYLYRKISFKSLFVIIAFILAFFLGVAMIKGQFSHNSESIDMRVVKKVAELPYRYVANNYWNLDYAFNKSSDQTEHPWTYGIDAFFGITQILKVGPGLQKSFGWDSPFNESVAKVTHLNTIPYLWDAYKDFGYPGIFLLPFFFGALFTYIYEKMLHTRSPYLYVLHMMFSLWIILWSFTTGYKQPLYWIWFVFATIICCISGAWKRQLPTDSTVTDEIAEENQVQQEITTEGE